MLPIIFIFLFFLHRSIDVDEGNITLRMLMDLMKDRFNLEVRHERGAPRTAVTMLHLFEKLRASSLSLSALLDYHD